MEFWKKWLNIALIAVLTLSLLSPGVNAEEGGAADSEASNIVVEPPISEASDEIEIEEITTPDRAEIMTDEAVGNVINLIEALPAIEVGDETTELALRAPRVAYNALTDEQKALVSNIDELVQKENRFTTLLKVQEVEQQIANLPTVETLQWTNKNEVEQVATKFEVLTEEDQALVKNYVKLEVLQQRLIELKPEPTTTTTEQAYNTVGNYMLSKASNPEFNYEWFIVALARGNYNVPADYYDTYYNNVVDYVQRVDGVLHNRKYTEYSRLILALTAIGKDPQNVGGYNLVEKLADFDKVVWQGVNGAYFALIALDTWGFELPETATTTRQKLIEHILSKQLADGGFALSGTKADPDMTGMALQALAPYKFQSNVSVAIDRAVTTLATIQKENGGYASWGAENVESAAQVVTALTSLGIDPTQDERFKKVIPNIMTFYNLADGGFKHVITEVKANGMATEQVGYTLAAYNRLLNGQSSLYNMLDTKPVVPEEPKPDETEQPKPGETEQPKPDETEQPKPGETEQPKPEQAYGYSTFSIVISSSEVPLVPITTEIFEGETVFDVLKRVTAENGVSLSYRDSTYGIYIEGINGLYEFDRGPESGWMYRVNGVFPSYSAALHVLQPGDRVEWLYTTDLGRDVGGYIDDIGKEEETETIGTEETDKTSDQQQTSNDQVGSTTSQEKATIIEVEQAKGKIETQLSNDSIQQQIESNKSTVIIQDKEGTKVELPIAILSTLELAADEKVVVAVEKATESKQITIHLAVEAADGTQKIIHTGKQYVKVTLPAQEVSKNTVVLQKVDGEQRAVPHKIVNGEIVLLVKSSGTFVLSEEQVTFKDIDKLANKSSIEFLASRHVIKRKDAETFAPNAAMTRAHFASLISRALGLQATTGSKFKDTVGKWYAADVQALYEAGITTGKTDTTFDPEANITRQQAAALMARVLEYMNYEKPAVGEVSFTDVETIGANYKESIALLQKLDIISGKEDGSFDAGGQLTRAQMAKILKLTLNTAGLM